MRNLGDRISVRRVILLCHQLNDSGDFSLGFCRNWADKVLTWTNGGFFSSWELVIDMGWSEGKSACCETSKAHSSPSRIIDAEPPELVDSPQTSFVGSTIKLKPFPGENWVGLDLVIELDLPQNHQASFLSSLKFNPVLLEGSLFAADANVDWKLRGTHQEGVGGSVNRLSVGDDRCWEVCSGHLLDTFRAACLESVFKQLE